MKHHAKCPTLKGTRRARQLTGDVIALFCRRRIIFSHGCSFKSALLWSSQGVPYGVRPVCRSASIRFTSDAGKLSANCSSSSRATPTVMRSSITPICTSRYSRFPPSRFPASHLFFTWHRCLFRPHAVHNPDDNAVIAVPSRRHVGTHRFGALPATSSGESLAVVASFFCTVLTHVRAFPNR